MSNRKQLRIIQLASYRGNIGDNANLSGTRRMLQASFPDYQLEFTDLEYLEYEPDPRWGGKSFDCAFIDVVNQHDLLIIGGGGFFEVSIDDSCTGTPLDLSAEILQRIKPPKVFYALGVETCFGIPEERLRRFRNFLEYLSAQPDTLVSVRNDGSQETLRTLVGVDLANRIDCIPDGGFFAKPKDFEHIELTDDNRILAINLAGDNLGLRFPDHLSENRWLRLAERNYNRVRGRRWVSSRHQFIAQLADVTRKLLDDERNLHVVFVPHIPEDLPIIGEAMAAIGPPFSRRRVTVAPYVIGNAAADYILDIYKRSSLIIGMRFHTNVCGIGFGVPTIGIESAFAKVRGVYDELGIKDRAICACDPEFEDRLGDLARSSLAEQKSIALLYRARCEGLEADIGRFYYKIRALIEKDNR